jgi:hypothetical protein
MVSASCPNLLKLSLKCRRYNVSETLTDDSIVQIVHDWLNVYGSRPQQVCHQLVNEHIVVGDCQIGVANLQYNIRSIGSDNETVNGNDQRAVYTTTWRTELSSTDIVLPSYIHNTRAHWATHDY